MNIIDDVLKSEDPRYADSFYDLFKSTKNIDIRCKILDFFAKAEDPCLEDFCVDVLNDPYDLPLKVIESVFKYVSAVKCKLVAPAVVEILEIGKEEYFNPYLLTGLWSVDDNERYNTNDKHIIWKFTIDYIVELINISVKGG